jgi:hypothetical protein
MLLSAAVLAVLLSPICPAKAPEKSKPASPQDLPGPTEETEVDVDRKVDEALVKRIEELSFVGTELEGALEYLRGLAGLSIYVKWDALELVGIDKSKEINVRLWNVSVEKALRVVLEDAGGTTPLGFIADEGVITISTKEDLSTRRITRVYDVNHLIDWTEGEEVEALLELIVQNVDRRSWIATRTRENIGSVNHLKGSIAVTQTPENHEALERLLDSLSEMTSKRRPSPQARARQAGVQIKHIGTMKEACFDPAAMGMIAVVGLRDEVPRDSAQVIPELEQLLKETSSPGLRNAIRLTLKDLYKAQGDNEAVLKHLRAMLVENEQTLQGKRP